MSKDIYNWYTFNSYWHSNENKIKLVGHVKTRNVFNISVGNPWVLISLGLRWEDKIRMILKTRMWCDLAWAALGVSPTMDFCDHGDKLSVSKTIGNFMIRSITINWSWKMLLDGTSLWGLVKWLDWQLSWGKQCDIMVSMPISYSRGKGFKS